MLFKAGASTSLVRRFRHLASKRAASWAGWFMAITFVTSIPALLLYHSVLHDHSYILGAGHDARIEFAAVLEVFLMISGAQRCKRERFAVGRAALIDVRQRRC
jgi:hypothetical protein